MRQFASAELSRRSLYLSLGSLEVFAEFRAADWPSQWSRLREPGSVELWMGRAYFCLSRTPPIPLPAPQGSGDSSGSEQPECKVLAFKAPVRAA